MSLRTQHVVNLNSTVGAVTNSPWLRTAGARVTVQIVTAPVAIVQMEGAATAEGTAAALTFEAVGGVAAFTNQGAGIYEVREKPGWIRLQLAADAGGPRVFRAILTFDVEE